MVDEMGLCDYIIFVSVRGSNAECMCVECKRVDILKCWNYKIRYTV